MERYFVMYPYGKGSKGKTPSKADRLAYAAALQPGFEHFDREVGSRIAKYTAEARAENANSVR